LDRPIDHVVIRRRVSVQRGEQPPLRRRQLPDPDDGRNASRGPRGGLIGESLGQGVGGAGGVGDERVDLLPQRRVVEVELRHARRHLRMGADECGRPLRLMSVAGVG
jgi:hypothetical protein